MLQKSETHSNLFQEVMPAPSVLFSNSITNTYYIPTLRSFFFIMRKYVCWKATQQHWKSFKEFEKDGQSKQSTTGCQECLTFALQELNSFPIQLLGD